MGQRFRVDEIAPLFREQAKEYYLQKGWSVQKIHEHFCEQYGDTAVARSSFYRWWDDVYQEHKLDAATRAKALAVLEMYAPDDERLGKATFSIAQQQVAELLHVTRGEWDVNDLRKLLATLDRIRRTDLAIDEYKREVQERTQVAAREAEKKLRDAGVKKATVDQVVKQVYGIAG